MKGASIIMAHSHITWQQGPQHAQHAQRALPEVRTAGAARARVTAQHGGRQQLVRVAAATAGAAGWEEEEEEGQHAATAQVRV